MSRTNQQRRADKRRRRATQHVGRSRPVSPPPPFVDDPAMRALRVGAAALAFRDLALRRAAGLATPADELAFLHHPVDIQQAAIDDQLRFLVRGLADSGWAPSDLHEVLRRHVDPAVGRLVLDVLAAAVRGISRRDLHPAWLSQPADLGAHGRDADVATWARRAQLDWDDACAALIRLGGLLCELPALEPTLPAPGTSGSGLPSAPVADERVLRRVRALLAKAEATEFADEAEAFTAKAQQLTTVHAIDRAMADAAAPTTHAPTVRRVWLDAPYVDSKALLVAAVADANTCRCVFTKQWGFVTLVGFTSDLDLAELLSTSLLVQATRAMTAVGSQYTRTGTSRTRSYRQSFLVAYAGRIRERLRDAAADVTATADAARGGTLLPVLSQRADRVDAKLGRLFPQTTSHGVRVSHEAGYAAGRAAADLAVLSVREAVEQERAG
ncbi:MAG: DUF2786 domain-containing protein [Jatrophihabitans sp.]|uniref:DUF2786 domain-containing protein n=1 Tax=Jatrophihabitans sp. TaxID=1932789 RepID=UPI003F7E4CC7